MMARAQGDFVLPSLRDHWHDIPGAAAGSGVCVDAAVLPQGVPRLALAGSCNAGAHRMSVPKRWVWPRRMLWDHSLVPPMCMRGLYWFAGERGVRRISTHWQAAAVPS